jgi:hypothetical protein
MIFSFLGIELIVSEIKLKEEIGFVLDQDHSISPTFQTRDPRSQLQFAVGSLSERIWVGMVSDCV